jgi:hypothetical protein
MGLDVDHVQVPPDSVPTESIAWPASALSWPTATQVVALGQLNPIICPPAPSEAIFVVVQVHVPPESVPADAIESAPSPPTDTHEVALTQARPWRNPVPDRSSGIVADVDQVHVPPESVPIEKIAWVTVASSNPTATHDVALMQLTSSSTPPPDESGGTTTDFAH